MTRDHKVSKDLKANKVLKDRRVLRVVTASHAGILTATARKTPPKISAAMASGTHWIVLVQRAKRVLKVSKGPQGHRVNKDWPVPMVQMVQMVQLAHKANKVSPDLKVNKGRRASKAHKVRPVLKEYRVRAAHKGSKALRAFKGLWGQEGLRDSCKMAAQLEARPTGLAEHGEPQVPIFITQAATSGLAQVYQAQNWK